MITTEYFVLTQIETYLMNSFFLRFYFFLERAEGMETGRETSMCERIIDWLPLPRPQPGTWPATQACALMGNQTSDFFGSQVSTQSTEPCQQGPHLMSS